MVPEVLGKVKDVLMHYGVPAALFVGGYFAGDIMKVGDFIGGLIPAEYAGKITPKVLGIITAAILICVAVVIWSMFGPVGPAIGAFLAGMGVSVIVSALRGK